MILCRLVEIPARVRALHRFLAKRTPWEALLRIANRSSPACPRPTHIHSWIRTSSSTAELISGRSEFKQSITSRRPGQTAGTSLGGIWAGNSTVSRCLTISCASHSLRSSLFARSIFVEPRGIVWSECPREGSNPARSALQGTVTRILKELVTCRIKEPTALLDRTITSSEFSRCESSL